MVCRDRFSISVSLLADVLDQAVGCQEQLGGIASTRVAERQDWLQVGDQALQLNATLSVCEKRLSVQLEDLQYAQWTLVCQVQDAYAEAIAVRLIVHDWMLQQATAVAAKAEQTAEPCSDTGAV